MVSYLRDYASNILASSQGDYHNNPYDFYTNLMYGYYKNNINGDSVGFNNPPVNNVGPSTRDYYKNSDETTKTFLPLKHDLNPHSQNWPNWYRQYNQPNPQANNWNNQPSQNWYHWYNKNYRPYKNYHDFRQNYDDRWLEKRYRDYYGNFKRSHQVDKYVIFPPEVTFGMQNSTA